MWPPMWPPEGTKYMQTEMSIQQSIEAQPPATEYLADEPVVVEQFASESHVEEDGVDWCAWWAEYAEMME
jgi:hypothetical protein